MDINLLKHLILDQKEIFLQSNDLISRDTEENTKDLIEYATRQKNVHIVSPTSFYAYLQTVMQGLKALKTEESIKQSLYV